MQLNAGLSAATGLTFLSINNHKMNLETMWEQLSTLLPCWPLLQVGCPALPRWAGPRLPRHSTCWAGLAWPWPAGAAECWKLQLLTCLCMCVLPLQEMIVLEREEEGGDEVSVLVGDLLEAMGLQLPQLPGTSGS